MERDRLAFLLETPSFSQLDSTPPFCIPNAPDSEVSPSPVRTPSPSQVTPVRLVTPPQSSGEQPVAEEDAVFHTPPEHHPLSHLSSSEDQNQQYFCAEEPAVEGARVMAGEEFGGDTVSLDETQVVVETQEVVFGGGLDEDSVGDGGLVNDGVAMVDGVAGNHELGGEIENVVDIGGGKKPNDDTGDSSGGFDSRKIEGDKSCLKVRLRISGFDRIDKGVEIAMNAEKVTNEAEMPEDGHMNEGIMEKITKDAEMQKDGHMNEGIKEKFTKDVVMQKDGCGDEGAKSSGKISKKKKKKTRDAEMQKDDWRNEGVRSSGKRSKKRKHGRRNEGASSSGKNMVEIEEFRFVSEVDGKRRKLPPSVKGKEKDAGECLDQNNGLPLLLEAKEKDFGEVSEKNKELQPSSEGKEDFGKSLESKTGTTPSEKEKDVGECSKKNSDWQDFMDLLKLVNPFLDRGNEDEDVDWLQTAKDRCLICVKYRNRERCRALAALP